MKRIGSFIMLIFLIGVASIISTSCGGSVSYKSNEETLIDTVKQVKYIDIPRTHEGVTLGQSYNEVINYFKNKKIDPEDWITTKIRKELHYFDNYPRMKYAEYQIPVDLYNAKWIAFECFDNKVYKMIVLLPDGVKDKIIEKYPFEVVNVEGKVVTSYSLTGPTYVSDDAVKRYGYSNGESVIEIFDFGPLNEYGIYYDAKLKEKADAYMKQVDQEKENQKNAELDSQMSNY